jgi:hypothetical protein
MTYHNFQFINPLQFERRSPSGALTRFIVFPEGGNRTATIMTLDVPFEDVPRWMRNDWQVTSCDSEEEFISRFGRELFEKIAGLWDTRGDNQVQERNLEVANVITRFGVPMATKADFVGGLNDVLQNSKMEHKLAFVQSVHKTHSIADGRYQGVPSELIEKYRECINLEFQSFIVVNSAFAGRIIDAIRPLCEKFGHYETMNVDIKVQTGTDEINPVYKRHNRAHRSDAVRLLLSALEEFVARAKAVLADESLANISAVTLAYSMCDGAIRGFKLFEQE